MGIKAVIFDFGGVLVRTGDLSPRQHLAARLGLSYDEISQLVFESESARRATLGQITTQQHWDSVRKKLGLSPEELPSVPLQFWGGDALDTGLVEFIRSLQPAYKTGLLSNAWDNLRAVLENGYKIADAFDEIIISAEVGMAKPDPRIYRLALQRLDTVPGEAVFVDDFAENVEAARAVGVIAIHFANPAQVRAELQQLLQD